MVGVRHYFIRLFGGAIEIGRLVGFVFHAKRSFFVEAINRRGRGIDEFKAGERAASFENRDEALQIGCDVIIGFI